MGFRWPTMPGSGRAQVAQQVGAIGAAVGVLGEELNAQQAEVELQAFRIQFEGEIDALGDRIAKNQDENTYIPETDKVIAGTNKYMPKNGLAKRHAAEFVSRRTPQLHDDARASQKLRIQSKWDAGLITEVDTAIQRGHTIDLTRYVNKGLENGNIDEADRAKVLSDTTSAVREANRGRGIQALIKIGMAEDNEDAALDAVLKVGLELGIDKADINFAQQQIKDDFARLKAVRKDAEESRVSDIDADLSRRIYDAQQGETMTTTAEVHAAGLPRTVRDPLLTSIRLRDKDVAEGKDIITSSFTQIKVNSVISRVAKGDLTKQQGYARIRNFEHIVNVDERNANINAVTKAAESATDETKRRNATILDEREKKLRDAIERSQGVIQLVKDEEREFLRDVANIAVIELNDRFRGLDFTIQEIDAFNDDLMRKYTLSQKDINKALREKGSKEAVKQRDVEFLDKLLRGGR